MEMTINISTETKDYEFYNLREVFEDGETD